jgi:L-aminopeptidase/D-esterase-like protein
MKEAAYKACAAASTGPVAEGSVGVGAGATVGKMHRRALDRIQAALYHLAVS